QHLTLLCRDLAEIGHFARVDNRQYRFLKLATPGPWTFILEATREVPRRVSHPSRKTIGIRVPDHKVTLDLLEAAGSPLISTTLIPEGEDEPLNDAEQILERYGHQLAAVIDGGASPLMPTTVIDLSGPEPVVVRRGGGDPAVLGLDCNVHPAARSDVLSLPSARRSFRFGNLPSASMDSLLQ